MYIKSIFTGSIRNGTQKKALAEKRIGSTGRGFHPGGNHSPCQPPLWQLLLMYYCTLFVHAEAILFS
tara:strand:- start:135 stop:335 length:201 start_codon:yes stop_codon:yes gene_type:complete